MPLSSKIQTSSISPSNKLEIKQAPPLGVTAIRHLNMLVCLYDEKVFLSGKIPGTLHSKLSAINNAPYFSHGLEHSMGEFT